MSTELMKLYVGNLSYRMSEEELESAFAAFGTVSSAKIIMDRDSNRSKGFGFVEFEDKAEAEAAIENLNGKDLGGRAVVVNEARPPKPRSNFSR
jgi:RNA recognition motif-containing protein